MIPRRHSSIPLAVISLVPRGSIPKLVIRDKAKAKALITNLGIYALGSTDEGVL